MDASTRWTPGGPSSKVRVADGRFVEVGDAASAGGGCTDVIDLRGRTVIPGMIDNHFHVQLVGSRPGYETRAIETAFTIAEAQAVVRERARSVPEGAFITAIEALQPRQFVENRLPTRQELEGAVPLGDECYQSVREVARHGWQMMEHSFNEPNHAARAELWERVSREFPITDLRWSIDHVNTIEPKTLARMKALGVGVRAHGWRFLAGTPGQAGPPYRMLLDSGMARGHRPSRLTFRSARPRDRPRPGSGPTPPRPAGGARRHRW